MKTTILEKTCTKTCTNWCGSPACRWITWIVETRVVSDGYDDLWVTHNMAAKAIYDRIAVKKLQGDAE